MKLKLVTLERVVQSLHPDRLAKYSVSIKQAANGRSEVVSRYGDVTWDFYPYVETSNRKVGDCAIHWDCELPDGSVLTDPKHRRLLKSCKAFIWSLYDDPVDGRARPTFVTLVHRWTHLKHLLSWMVANGISSFTQLRGRCLEYVDHAHVRLNGTGVVVPETVAHRLSIVEDLYNQRHKLKDAVPVHPWPGETTYSMAGVSERKVKTNFIPDSAAEKLVKAALKYVREKSPAILNAERTAFDMLGSTPLSKGRRKIVANRRDIALEYGFTDRYELSADLLHLRTACFSLINLFAGLRDSEISSIEVGCVRPGKARDGITDVYWLHGTVYKTGVKAHRWLVPQIVEEAVAVLTKLTEPHRQRLQVEEQSLKRQIQHASKADRRVLIRRLHQVEKVKNKLFLGVYRQGGASVTLTSTAGRNASLRAFCRHMNVTDDAGNPLYLHTHMFRRTYARNVARAELGDLLTLREHFAHWSLDMTAYYADGATDEFAVDTELLDMVSEEKVLRQQEIIGTYLNSDAPLANGSHWLKEWRGSVRTAPNKEQLVAEYADTITLNGTGHSWCVGNAKKTGCGGLCIFEAQMCVDCNYGVIGPEHRPVWQGIKLQQIEALELDDIGPGGRARAQTILGYAEKVLARLDGEEVA